MGAWVTPTIRDDVVEFVQRYSEKTGLPRSSLVSRIGIGRDKFYEWRRRRGRTNDHNGTAPRDFWLHEWETRAILAFHHQHPDEGYRRLAFLMLDAEVVAASPSSVYRALKRAGRIHPSTAKPSHKGTGFKQPSEPHKHWHVDVSYLNIRGTFYYFCGILDGCSRYLVHWEIRESMKETDVETIVQRAREKFPDARPRIISDNGPQFIARDFKEFIRISGMTHVRTSPYYPESNGKIERFHQSLKRECIRPKTPLSLADARRIVAGYVDHYNNERLHAAIGYITPKDKLEGREKVILEARKRKLHQAREERKALRQLERLGLLGSCLTEVAA
jgi:transposase InsO family protein